MPLNVPLLRKIQAHILEEPLRVDMDNWMGTVNQYGQSPACKTVGCIAGWACVLEPTQNKEIVLGVKLTAMDLLGIGHDLADKLFYPAYWYHGWPSKLEDLRVGTPAYAQVVSDYIDYFIEQHREVA
jgi:hypothetical protein